MVQLLVIRGEKVLGVGTNNVSACLVSEIRRVGDIVWRLGALVSGLPVSCCCEAPLGRRSSGEMSPRSWRPVELGSCCVCLSRCDEEMVLLRCSLEGFVFLWSLLVVAADTSARLSVLHSRFSSHGSLSSRGCCRGAAHGRYSRPDRTRRAPARRSLGLWCVCAVELVEYLDRLDTLYEVARQRQERGKWGGVMPKRFDSTVITRLILAAPRERQEAVVWESRHCGLQHVRCPLVVMSTLFCLLAQESFRASGGESHSDG